MTEFRDVHVGWNIKRGKAFYTEECPEPCIKMELKTTLTSNTAAHGQPRNVIILDLDKHFT